MKTHKKIRAKKIEKTQGLAFFQIFSQKLFAEFSMFDNWNCLGGTKNDIYRLLLPV